LLLIHRDIEIGSTWEPRAVCSYCGCRALVPIAELTEEHVQILSLSADIRRAVGRGEHVVAAALLATLTDVLELHDAVEELALYPAMTRDPELAEKVGTLFDEHDELDRVVRCTLAATGADPSTADWAGLLTALEMLAEHIDHEEHGVFPAAAVSLDPSDWEHAAHVRAQRVRRPDQPTEPWRALAGAAMIVTGGPATRVEGPRT
jgi:hemerythrin-like domain-containing protein